MCERLRFLCRPQLLIVDEIGYLPVVPGGGNLFFQPVNARYERGAMILTEDCKAHPGALSAWQCRFWVLLVGLIRTRSAARLMN